MCLEVWHFIHNKTSGVLKIKNACCVLNLGLLCPVALMQPLCYVECYCYVILNQTPFQCPTERLVLRGGFVDDVRRRAQVLPERLSALGRRVLSPIHFKIPERGHRISRTWLEQSYAYYSKVPFIKTYFGHFHRNLLQIRRFEQNNCKARLFDGQRPLKSPDIIILISC